VLPQWEVKDELGEKAGGRRWSPLVASLQWPAEEECLIEEGRAEAVTAGAALIAQLVEPVARSAWMRTTQRSGVAQATSEEDCGCTAVQALLLAMEAQFGPPPPLDSASGERRWGGRGGGGVALCPLANLAAPLSQRTPPRHVPWTRQRRVHGASSRCCRAKTPPPPPQLGQ